MAAEFETVWAAAQEAWPEFNFAREAFASFCDRLAAEPEAPLELSAPRAADLYLAAACAAGDAPAIAAFHREFGPFIAKLAERAASPGISANDAGQSVLTRLLVATEDGGAKIGTYRGLGSLKSWVRSVAARAIINMHHSAGAARREVALGETLFEQIADGVDPEMEFLKKQYRAEFKTAFEEAVAELSPRARNHLRHMFIDKLTVDQVGAIYGIHRSTAARQLASARDALLAGTRDCLGRRLGASEDDVASIVRLIGSRWDLSISRVFSDIE